MQVIRETNLAHCVTVDVFFDALQKFASLNKKPPSSSSDSLSGEEKKKNCDKQREFHKLLLERQNCFKIYFMTSGVQFDT